VAHVRQQVREALAIQLTGLTTTGAKVFQSRVYPLESSDLPCLLIATEEEENEYLNINFPSSVHRRINASVKAVVENIADLDDVVDTICSEIEVAVATDVTLGGAVRAIKLLNTSIEIETEGEKPVGIATMVFECEVFTLENAPDTAL